MATVDEVQLLSVLTARIGDRTKAQALATAYIAGARDYALERTAGTGAVPTNLTGERVELLLAVSKQLSRLIDSREIECLLRVVPAVAKRLQLELRSTHEDTIRSYIFQWALANGTVSKKRGSHGGVTGRRAVFATEDQLEAFAAEANRGGYATARDINVSTRQWALYVPDAVELLPYLPNGYT